VPVPIAIIAIMLFVAFRSLRYTMVTLLNLPFAVAGGLLALRLGGLSFSIPAGVGFIALCGVSVITGIVMTTNLLRQPPQSAVFDRVRDAVLASFRARISTAVIAAIGFVPAAIATGTGAEVLFLVDAWGHRDPTDVSAAPPSDQSAAEAAA
jgi:heavy metal efflux system protein